MLDAQYIKMWNIRNPTPEPSDLIQNVIWPKINAGQLGDLFYLDINTDLSIRNHPKEQTYAGWKSLYEKLGYDDFDSYWISKSFVKSYMLYLCYNFS